MGKFETLFEEALKSDGNRYRQIRSEVMALKSDEVVTLENKAQDPDWRVRLHAEIFRGWRTDLERYEYIRRVTYGTEPTMEPEEYLTGKPPVEKRSHVLVNLGSSYLPILLEIMYKEPDLLTKDAFNVCTKTILAWNDMRAVPVFRELLMNHTVHPAYRGSSILPLFNLNADHLYDDLISIYKDEKNPTGLRATSIATMGALKDSRAMPLLTSILTNPGFESELRCAAAGGLVETKNPAVIDLLVEQYALTDNVDLKASIILALGAIEDRRAMEPLQEIRSRESDSGLLEIIDETLEDLEQLE